MIEIPNTNGLVKNAELIINVTEIESEITDTVDLTKKTCANTKISEVENQVSRNAN